ncbi:bromodomain containing protein [Stylonychia lemnae]|uniref:Bromodomain containing protein n=1 Tax=Stylonychia lemnae TaxID=5949 RepID=A0A078AJH8_STYLE|nr:bromodomain containing protein [Stylonychia lemnae]|eukprot:CDW80938.1 bromodomain containing protein [Stylonychia lemnae]
MQVHSQGTRFPIKKDDIPKIKALIQSIEDDPNAEPFLEPVQWQELGLDDYPQIIKKPMDFSTVKKGLAKGKYNTYDELFAEIQLIWDNCKTYNVAGSDIYKLAEYMEKVSKRQISKFRSQMGIQSVSFAVPNKKAGVGKDKKKSGGNQDDKSDGEDEEESNIVTVEMKIDFVERVKQLSNEGLTQMVQQIQQIIPSAVSDIENEKLQIKVDEFDKEAFNKISDFIDELLLNEQPSKRQKTE